MSFSKRLRELREKKGLSQEALAEKLNIPRSSVTHYETSDDRTPRKTRLKEIADFFGVSVDYLIGRADTTEYKDVEKSFMNEILDPNADLPSLEKLQEKYGIAVDGRPATEEEIKFAISVIRSLRNQ